MSLIVVPGAGSGPGPSAKGAGELVLAMTVLGSFIRAFMWVGEQFAALNRAVVEMIEANLGSIYTVLAIATVLALAALATWIEARRPERHFRLWFYFILRTIRFALIPLALAGALFLGVILIDAFMLMEDGGLPRSDRNYLGLGVLAFGMLICASIIAYGITQRFWGYLPAIVLIAAPFLFVFAEGGPHIATGLIVNDVIAAGVPLFAR